MGAFGAAKLLLPANYINRIGKRFQVRASGRISNIVTTPGTLTLRFKLGSVNVWDSGAISLNTTAKTTLPWTLRVSMRASTMGSSTAGKVYAIGEFQSECVVGSPAPTSGGSGRLLVPVGAVAESSGFDMTAEAGDWAVDFGLRIDPNTGLELAARTPETGAGRS